MNYQSRKGNVLTISLIFIAIAMILFLFIISIFTSQINSVLYHIKLDMYSMNRSAIIAVNKNKANIDYFTYDKETYKNEFIKLLKSSYNLDQELKNDSKLISGIEIKEYEIYEKRKVDSYTGKRCDDRVIHTVLKVKIRPVIWRSFLENIFVFDIHEDVNINMMNV